MAKPTVPAQCFPKDMPTLVSQAAMFPLKEQGYVNEYIGLPPFVLYWFTYKLSKIIDDLSGNPGDPEFVEYLHEAGYIIP